MKLKILFSFIVFCFLSVNTSFAQCIPSGTKYAVEVDDDAWRANDVSIDGQWALVAGGEEFSNAQNIIHCYKLTSGVWSLAQTIDRSAWSDNWGRYVSHAGNYMVVSNSHDDTQGTNRGRAMIYYYNGSSWVFSKYLYKPSTSTTKFWGTKNDIDGSCAIVGYNPNAGSNPVCIYRRDGVNWPMDIELSPGGVTDVAIAGNYAFLGRGGNQDVLVYKYNGTTWTLFQTLTPGTTSHNYGSSLSADNNYLIVGANGDDQAASNAGAAYIYYFNGTTWSLQTKITASDAVFMDYFGCSVDIKNDYAIVGANGDDDEGSYSGSAYVFHREGTSWSQIQKVTDSDGAANDQFGYAVSIHPPYLMVGSPFDDVSTETDNGSMSIFDGFMISTPPTSISGTGTICRGASVTLTAQGATLVGDATYQWYAGGCGSGSVLGTGQTLTISPTSTTTFYCRVNGTCNTTTCASGTVTVHQPTVAGTVTQTPITGSTVCSGSNVNYSFSGGTGAFVRYQYQWNSTAGAWTNWSTSNPHNWTSSSPGNRLYVRALNKNGVCAAAYSTPVQVDVDGAGPTHDNVTVSSNCWNTSGSNNYTVTYRASDPSGIGGSTYGMMILINYQGANAGSYGGYYAWNTTQAGLNAAGFTLDQHACSGGGWVGKRTTYGNSTATLISGSTSVSGNQRTVNFVIRPNNTFPAITQNDISTYAGDGCGNIRGWINWDLNFSSGDNPGTVSAASSVCNGNNVTYTWTAGEANQTFVRFQYQWNSTAGAWTNWSTTNPHNWPSNNPGNRLYVRAVSTIGNCTYYSPAIYTDVINDFSVGAITGASSSTQCNPYDPPTLTANPSGGAGTYTYQWQNSADGSTWSDISGATAQTYDPASISTTTHYRVIVDATGTPDCGGATASTNTIVFTIRPVYTSGAIYTTGQTICAGGDPSTIGSSSDASGGDESITYKWQANGSDILSSNSATYDPPSGLTSNTTYTRWAKDATCSTTFTQSTGSWTVNVITPTPPTGILSGDYFWSGEISASWNTPENWLQYNGTSYVVPSVLPSAINNVFIQEYSTCATTHPVTNVTSTVFTNDINIGSSLSLGNTSRIEVSGNWNNSGTFTSGTGTVAFVGNVQQSITTNGERFYNVDINNISGNNAAVLVNSDFRIDGQLTFTNGIVSFADPINKLTLGSSATTNEGTATSFVNGIVEKISCNTLITLPTGHVTTRDIGSGDQLFKIWAPIGLNPVASTTVNARYLFSNQGLNTWWYHDWTHQAPLTHTSDREYWLVNASSDLNATLHWKNNNPCEIHDFCEHGTGTFLHNDLTIAYWDGIWKDAGGTAATDFENGSISSLIPFSAKGETQITFGAKNPDLPLPVELSLFTANCNNNVVHINWQTETEINNDYFILEKSLDLENFETVTIIDGAGNSNKQIEYQYVDNLKTSASEIYYRLSQVDFDGAKKVFPIIGVNCEQESDKKPSFVVYPNPNHGKFYVHKIFGNPNHVLLEIFDEFGRLVFSQQVSNEAFSTPLSLDLHKLKPAVYHLKITADNTISNHKVVIQ